MIMDCYGKRIDIGDVVTRIGSSEEFVVTGIHSLKEKFIDIEGKNWNESKVLSSSVIVKLKKGIFCS